MSVKIEHTSALGRKINFAYPAEDLEKKVTARIRETAKSAKIDGFRPGKVPEKIIRNRFGKQIHNEVVGEVIQSTWEDTLKEHQELKPAGNPTIESVHAEPGQSLEYTISFEVYPEITLNDFSAITIERDQVEVTDEDIQGTIERIRKQHPQWERVDRPAEKGDKLFVDIDILVGEGAEAKKEQSLREESMVLGANRFIPGLEEGLIGVKGNETRELSLNFPEDYHVKRLSGQPAKFTVMVHAIEEPKYYEFNESLAESLGVKEGGIDALKEQVAKHMRRDLDNFIRNKLKKELFTKLIEQNPIEVPTTLVNAELEYQHRMLHKHDEGEQAAHAASDHPGLKEEALRRVTISLLIGEIIKQNKIVVDSNRVQALVVESASVFDFPEQMIAWYYSDKKRLARFESLALEEQVVDFIIERAQVTEKAHCYVDFMQIDSIEPDA
jgi:trigger factor